MRVLLKFPFDLAIQLISIDETVARNDAQKIFRNSMSQYLKLLPAFLLIIGLKGNLPAQDYWVKLSPPTSRHLYELHFLDNRLGWAAGERGAILKTTDGGQSWAFQTSNIDRDILDIFMLDAARGWGLAHLYPAGADSVYGTYILKTTDGGNNWSPTFYPEQYFFTIMFHDPLHGWMGGDGGVLLGTTNGGADWFEANVNPGSGSGFPIHNIRFFSPHYGYAMGGRFDIAGVVWRTVNGGDRWDPIVVGPEPIYDMHFEDSLKILAIGGDLDFGSGQVSTSDGGLNWTYLYLGIFGQARALSFRTKTEAWAPLGFTGTYMYTLDGGRSWTDLYTPDSSAVYDLVFTDSLTGYAVGDSGTVLKYRPGIVPIIDRPSPAPASAELYANYPNPFNPSTNIGFRISDFGWVDLSVFDITGRKVITLVEKERSPGEYEVQWNGRDEFGKEVSSGVYIYRLSAGKFAQSRKMLLVR